MTAKASADDISRYDVRIIANPMAGKDEPFFGPLAAAFGDANIRWNIDVTNGPGEEAALAQRAVAEGAKVVVAFGGDGTVSAVAEAIAGSSAVLGILPGGTANVFAKELGIPLDLEAAAKLLAGPHELRDVDLGCATFADGISRVFILRVSAGLEATMVEEAPREQKERFGQLAYALSAIRQLPGIMPVHYTIEAKDTAEKTEGDGLFAVVTNARLLGTGNAAYPEDVKPDDGIIDGIIAPFLPTRLVEAAASAVTGTDSDSLTRIRGKELVLSAEPPQRVSVDGEVIGDTPVSVTVRASAVRVIAPRQ